MADEITVRWGWLRGMYLYTLFGAGGFGLGMLCVPETLTELLGWPLEEPITVGIVGSVYTAFGLLSLLGLRAPLAFAPVLLLQLVYKSIVLIGVVLPLLAGGHAPEYAVLVALVFATYIIGDLIAIPFSYLFAKPADQPASVHYRVD